jgi:hypothetical protein
MLALTVMDSNREARLAISLEVLSWKVKHPLPDIDNDTNLHDVEVSDISV